MVTHFILILLVNLAICDALRSCGYSKCVLAASKIQDSMNPALSPCTDFYQFVCDGFTSMKGIPQDDYVVNGTSDMVEQQLKDLRHLIEDINVQNEIKPVKLLHRFYNNCMNLDYNNVNDLERMHDFVHLTGGWPVLDKSWHKDQFSVMKTLSSFYDEGFSANYLFKLSMELDPAKVDSYILTIDQPDLEFSKDVLVERSYKNYKIMDYLTYMSDIAELLEAPVENIHNHLNKSLEFELTLLNYTLSKDQLLESTSSHIRTTVGVLQVDYPSIDWQGLINSFMNADVLVTVDQSVIIKVPEYLKKLDNLIRDTDVETQADYLLWKAVADCVPFLTDKFRQRYLTYNALMLGQKYRKPLWKECVETTNKYFPAVTTLLYSRTPKYTAMKFSTIEVMNEIKHNFPRVIHKGNYMENIYKDILSEKINTMSYNIGSSKSVQETELADYYRDLNIYTGNHFESMLNVLKNKRQFFLRQINRPASHGEDWLSAIDTPFFGSTFQHSKNRIVIPIGDLNELNSESKFPYYTKFAGIGTVIGHELSHAYDRMGRQFNQYGEYDDWCKSSCDKHFFTRDQCVIDQYNNYISTAYKEANTYVTQEQNIADVEGVNMAYKAYIRWLSVHNEEPQFPNLNYNNYQMFWIWYASLHCTNYRPNAYSSLIKNGVSTCPRFRVNNPLRNSHYFANDFDCKVGDYMNLDKTKRCTHL